MRKGQNSAKEQLIEFSNTNHRIIIPLYIPHENDYYKDAFLIFEMCLKSIHKTSNYKNKISVISDGCCDSVNNKLVALYKDGLINELILESKNIGKINSILKALRTVNEAYVTITDADILFLNHWDKNVFEIFNTFKKAAVVSPIPVFRKQLSFTSNIWIDYLFSNKMSFKKVSNPEALERFAQSIGWDSLEDRFKDVILTLSHKNTTAVLSAVHCVATYKTSYLLKNIPKNNSNCKLGGQSEEVYLDIPPYKSGGYRLSTYNNFAYHLGNTLEDWMHAANNTLSQVKNKEQVPNFSTELPKANSKTIINNVFLRLLKNRKLYNYLLLKKGLTKKQLKTFWY